MINNNIYCKASGMIMQCIHDLQPKMPVVCEIGCAEGDGVARYGGFCKFVIAIDPMVSGRPDIRWSDEEGSTSVDKKTFYTHHPIDQKKLDKFWSNVSHLNDRELCGERIRLIQGCSLWKGVLDPVRDLMEEKGGIDILLIDGCHHPFEAVWADFDTYFPMVNDGGFIIFDDIYETCIREVYDRAKGFTSEVHEEWLGNKDHGLQEIGVLRK